jgi:hypothetical protein
MGQEYATDGDKTDMSAKHTARQEQRLCTILRCTAVQEWRDAMPSRIDGSEVNKALLMEDGGRMNLGCGTLSVIRNSNGYDLELRDSSGA